MAEQESGFEIKAPEAKEGRFYTWPISFRLGDPILVEKVTGLEWPAFTERLPEEDEAPAIDEEGEPEDLVVVIGLMAVSLWQHHPQWRRDRVVKYVERLELEKVRFVGGDEDEPEEEDARPPDKTAAGDTTSEDSPPASTPPPAESLDGPNPSSSGAQDSTTTSPDSLPAE